MTTTPNEPVADPNIVPSGEPGEPTIDPAAPGQEPNTETEGETDSVAAGPA